MATDVQTRNRAMFLAWLRNNYPHLYNEAMPSQQMGGFLDSLTSTFNTVLTNVTQALPNLANTYAQYQAQAQLIRMNTDRARQGLSPLVYQNGQLVDMQGQPYDADDLSLARTGGLSISTIAVIGAALFLGGIMLFRGGNRRR